MSGAFAVTEAFREDHEAISALYVRDMYARGVDALLRSGPPVELSAEELQLLYNRDLTIRCIARVVGGDGAVVAHASAHRTVHAARGCVASVEEVVTHPDVAGRGVGRGVMTSLMQYAFAMWQCVRMELVSEPHRGVARALYTSLGFVQQVGTDRFVCKEPNIAAYMRRIRGATTASEHMHTVFDVYTLKPAVPR